MNNKSVNWIIPMCGEGTRTSTLGKFKPLIEISGKTIFEHFLDGIKYKISKDDLITLIIKSNNKEYLKNQEILSRICEDYTICENVDIKLINHNTYGPCDTIRNVVDFLEDKFISIIINPDQKVDFELNRNLIDQNSIYLSIGFDNKKKSSYVLINKDSEIEKIKEKENISFYASTGIYIFGSNKLLRFCIRDFYSKNVEMYNGEHYISHLVDNAITNNIIVKPLETYLKYDLGNINSINNFIKTFN